ncbi:MAG: hypothetical protein COY80_01160 [Candidatus Pacebacteria bacterium CG_4_10_14_0_8_um_filter_42_14]|nr:MAG: hypothetical protein COY80_01160 [Candidatus Pacebacteria bacterium CG_4_10_14_0_8_um_filter_42_14]
MKNQQKTLITLLADIKNPKAMEEFLQSFLSKAELAQLSKRLEVIGRLKSGESYEFIQKQLGVSSATISGLSRIQDTNIIKEALKLISIDKKATKIASSIRRYVPFL